jgi:hypothetical protein
MWSSVIAVGYEPPLVRAGAIEGRAGLVSDSGGDEDEEASQHSHRKRVGPDGERLLAEEVDESLTDLLFGEVRESPNRER